MVCTAGSGGVIDHLRACLQGNDLEGAAVLAERVARACPRDAEALFLRGTLALRCGDLADAEPLLRAAVCQNPGEARYLGNLAVALRGRGDDRGAVHPLRAAMACDPHCAAYAFNLGNSLKALNRGAEAEAAYRRALSLEPAFAGGWLNLAGLYAETNRPKRAYRAYRAALTCGADAVEARIGLADVLGVLGKERAAERCLRQAIRARPAHAGARWNLALLLLRRGDLAKGFAAYEWRWRLPGYHGPRMTAPLWQGQSFPDKTLLVHAEQGFGDTLMFCRWLPAAVARVGSLTVVCPAPLVRLLRESFPGIAVMAQGDPLPPYDGHLPMMSLPRVLAVRKPEDAAVPVPYLGLGAAAEAGHQGRGDRRDPGLGAPRVGPPRVGLVWQGGAGATPTSWQRSVPFEALSPLWSVRGVHWVSLQVDAESIARLPDAPVPVENAGAGISDFLDTAKVVRGLDLVISVDTATAHLAGALGVPTWVLLRARADWRWFLDREDSPWYPTVSLYRQPASGMWAPVLRGVANRLRSALR